jgi:hypothetical protein
MLFLEEIGNLELEFFHFVCGLLWIVARRIGKYDLQFVGAAIRVIDFHATIDVEIDGGQQVADGFDDLCETFIDFELGSLLSG